MATHDGLLRRLLNDMLAPKVPDPPAEMPILTERRLLGPIAVAARGDAFDFEVRPTFTWTGKDMTEDDFIGHIDVYTRDALNALRLRIEPVARRFEPHLAQDLEDQVNALLAERDWELGPDIVTLICRPEVRILPDERVREDLQPYWRNRMRMQTEHELAMRRAELIRERTQAWSEVMATLQGNPIARHAALLVEHREFAEVFRDMTQGHKNELLKLIDMLEKAGASFNGIGLYEYAEGLDMALAEYRKAAGVA